MATTRDYYDILGVKKDASADEIKKAFRRSAVEHHPDRGGEEAKFKEINEAYEVLKDADKRKRYDQFGHAGVGGAGDGEVGGGADGVRPDVEAVIEPADDVDQTDGVHVKHRSGIRIISQLGRVAGEAEDVFESDGRCAQQVGLDAEDIAVAAGVMENRLNPGVLLNLDAQALRAHARAGAGRVGDVDGVDAQVVQVGRAFELFGAVDALGRRERQRLLLDDRFGNDDKLIVLAGNVEVLHIVALMIAVAEDAAARADGEREVEAMLVRVRARVHARFHDALADGARIAETSQVSNRIKIHVRCLRFS